MSDLAVYNASTEAVNKYIIFHVSKEAYGIDVSSVNNIIQMPKITSVPRTPDFYKGVINLRGEIIPIMSLRRRMNLEDDQVTKKSRVIILDLPEDKRMGVVVDDVKEVLSIPENEIEPPSPFLESEKSLIRGVGKKGDDLISIFEIGSIVPSDIQ